MNRSDITNSVPVNALFDRCVKEVNNRLTAAHAAGINGGEKLKKAFCSGSVLVPAPKSGKQSKNSFKSANPGKYDSKKGNGKQSFQKYDKNSSVKKGNGKKGNGKRNKRKNKKKKAFYDSSIFFFSYIETFFLIKYPSILYRL